MQRIEFSPKAVKDYKKLEPRIKKLVDVWVKRVKELGLGETKRIWANSYKDHPLQGAKEGRRSVYLNKQWRLEYTLQKTNDTERATVVISFVQVEEIHPHEYKK